MNAKDIINIAIEKKEPDEKHIYRKVQDLQLPMHIYYPEAQNEYPVDNHTDLKLAIDKRPPKVRPGFLHFLHQKRVILLQMNML